MTTVKLAVEAKEHHIRKCFLNTALLRPCCIIHKRSRNFVSLMEGRNACTRGTKSITTQHDKEHSITNYILVLIHLKERSSTPVTEQ